MVLSVIESMREMFRFIKRVSLFLLVSSFVLSLSGCVTSGGELFTAKIDMNRALKTRVELGLGYLKKGDATAAKSNMVRALEIDDKSSIAHAGFRPRTRVAPLGGRLLTFSNLGRGAGRGHRGPILDSFKGR